MAATSATTVTDAILRVLEAIGRVSGDTACPSSAITSRLDAEYRRLRRRVAAEFPTIYEKTSTSETLTTGVYLTRPTDCEIIRVLEKQSGNSWVPISVAPSLNRNEWGSISFYVQGEKVYIVPTSVAPGTYRFHYTEEPASGYTSMYLPAGLEDIVIEETAAWARVRHEEDPAPHKMAARQLWDDAYMGLWQAYGSHGRSGLNEALF